MLVLFPEHFQSAELYHDTLRTARGRTIWLGTELSHTSHDRGRSERSEDGAEPAMGRDKETTKRPVLLDRCCVSESVLVLFREHFNRRAHTHARRGRDSESQ